MQCLLFHMLCIFVRPRYFSECFIFLHVSLHFLVMVTASCRSLKYVVKIIYIFTLGQTNTKYQFTILFSIFNAMCVIFCSFWSLYFHVWNWLKMCVCSSYFIGHITVPVIPKAGSFHLQSKRWKILVYLTARFKLHPVVFLWYAMLQIYDRRCFLHVL